MYRVIHYVFNKEHKLLQYKVLMEKCWASHADLQKEKPGYYEGSGIVSSGDSF